MLPTCHGLRTLRQRKHASIPEGLLSRGECNQKEASEHGYFEAVSKNFPKFVSHFPASQPANQRCLCCFGEVVVASLTVDMASWPSRSCLLATGRVLDGLLLRSRRAQTH
ncbi:unnamed protein product [Protopolystoma xenopodis]|uniref:Uncharacterized protein n=1 Tax=Protopolystoma xenopodis TaxID=117903 RepID=A0A3S5BVR6_9PLAT|nr:unnamed protein product [Protopolystoma xenopodis]